MEGLEIKRRRGMVGVARRGWNLFLCVGLIILEARALWSLSRVTSPPLLAYLNTVIIGPAVVGWVLYSLYQLAFKDWEKTHGKLLERRADAIDRTIDRYARITALRGRDLIGALLDVDDEEAEVLMLVRLREIRGETIGYDLI